MIAFATNYLEARKHFLSAAKAVGASLISFQHPSESGLNGEPLSVELAIVGSANAENILFTVCGTHGVEGGLGSVAQQHCCVMGYLMIFLTTSALCLCMALIPTPGLVILSSMKMAAISNAILLILITYLNATTKLSVALQPV